MFCQTCAAFVRRVQYDVFSHHFVYVTDASASPKTEVSGGEEGEGGVLMWGGYSQLRRLCAIIKHTGSMGLGSRRQAHNVQLYKKKKSDSSSRNIVQKTTFPKHQNNQQYFYHTKFVCVQ